MKQVALALLVLTVPLANAGVIGVVDTVDGDRLEFHDTPGVCVGEARRMELVYSNKRKIPGCYVSREGTTFIVFLDGDIFHLPTARIRVVKEI